MLLTEPLKALAQSIFAVGAFKTKAQSPDGKGFRLKLHETELGAPLSPFFLDLRTADNPKPGLLTPEIVDEIGVQLYKLAKRQGINYDCIAGIPNAGDPFADAFAKAAAQDGRTIPVLRMKKTTDGGTRHISGLITPVAKGTRVLVIDDLITKAGSKMEAIGVLQSAGLIVVGIVVLVDRSAKEVIPELQMSTGVLCHSVFSIGSLLLFYVDKGLINGETLAEIIYYIFPDTD